MWSHVFRGLAILNDLQVLCCYITEQVWLLSTVLNLAFALSLLGFLIMHMSLVAGNTTTIEVPFLGHLV
jgi:palmitoyltransferase